jgi:hypothetical protein
MIKDQNRPVKTPTLDERIEAFVQLARTAEQGLMNACLALFELRQDYPAEELYPKIRKRLPVTDAFLDRMCEAAQKKFPAELLLYASPGASYLQTLPYEKGQQHIKEELPVVVPGERGFSTEYKMFHQLKHREVRQVFDGDRPDPPGEVPGRTGWSLFTRLRATGVRPTARQTRRHTTRPQPGPFGRARGQMRATAGLPARDARHIALGIDLGSDPSML